MGEHFKVKTCSVSLADLFLQPMDIIKVLKTNYEPRLLFDVTNKPGTIEKSLKEYNIRVAILNLTYTWEVHSRRLVKNCDHPNST